MLSSKMQIAAASKWTSLVILLIIVVLQLLASVSGQNPRRPQGNNRNRLGAEKSSVLKDAFYEDNNFVVRIRTTYNQTSAVTCNAVVMDERMIMSDVSCVKYQGMATIDAKFVQVISGEAHNETIHEVDKIYINKADPRDPGTELALLRLAQPLQFDSQCRQLILPVRNTSVVLETPVRVIGYTSNFELKENRSRIVRRTDSKYLCTPLSDLNETPGSQLLKGAPLLHMVDCKQYQLVGILTRVELDPPLNTPNVPQNAIRKHQDCYVTVAAQMRWYEQVRSLTVLAAKHVGSVTQPSVIVVSVDDRER